MTAAQRRPTAEGTRFRMDWQRLARDGFLCPDALDTVFAGEMNSLKRRLLRRLGFFQPQAAISGPTRSGNVALVTSAMPSEGKTFTVTNLALSLALEERIEVLLIDADLARPRICDIFGIADRTGLVDRLREPGRDVAEFLRHAEGLPLSILPPGSQRAPIAQIFAEGGLGALLEQIAKQFADRLILIDAPPLLATTEAAVLAEQAHQVLLVVEAGRSTRETVGAALELLDAKDKVGLVLNRCFLRSESSSGYYATYRPSRALDADLDGTSS